MKELRFLFEYFHVFFLIKFLYFYLSREKIFPHILFGEMSQTSLENDDAYLLFLISSIFTFFWNIKQAIILDILSYFLPIPFRYFQHKESIVNKLFY